MATKRRLLPSPRTTALLFPLLITRAYAHENRGNTVSSDVASLVPACAQECLASFVGGNFPGIDCSKAGSSLECVCGHTGASGFTVGEGAVQCLLAAKSVGICTGDEVDKTVMDQGYSICHGQPNYVRPTHSTIQATLSLDRSSRLLVPTPTLTTTFPSSNPTASVPSIGVPTTTTSPVTATSSTSKISSGRPTETGTTSSPNDAEEPEQARSGPSSGLSTAEIAGLAAGLVTAFAIALLTIALARRRRKKYYPDIETSFFMPRDKLKSLSRRFTVRPTGHSISAPLHGSPNRAPSEFPMGQHGPVPGNRPRTFIFPKSAQPTANVVRNPPRRTPTASPIAGLAVTAAAAVPLGANRSEPRRANLSESRPGSQGRPVLSLAIPKDTINPARARTRKKKPAPKRSDPGPKVLVTSPTMRPEIAARNAPVSSPPKPTVRVVDDDSPLTEFEEDGRDSPVQIWRPPSAAPNSAAAALYVADKFGNWVLADERQKKRISLAELEGSSPVISRGAGNAFAAGPSVAAAVPTTAPAPNPGGAGLRPPAEIYRQGEAGKGVASAASSVYSTDDSAWNPSNAPPIPANPLVPRPLATTRQTQRQPGAGPAPRPRYSPALNPFLDENGVSPVRSTFVMPLGPRPRTPGQGSTPRAPSRAGAQPPRQFARSPPGQPSPTLGALSKPIAPIYAANYSQRTPRTQQPPPSTYAPAPAPPPSTFAAAGPSAFQPSPTSSLLAKRLGHEKAASLSLRGSEVSSRSGGGGGGQLPSTPNWKPLLTPERRGEDLYLSLR